MTPARPVPEPLPRSADRPKDDRDLRVTWPLLGKREQRWSRDGIRRLYPDHPWRESMADTA